MASFVGDYTRIASLNYRSDDPTARLIDHTNPAAVVCFGLQMQAYLRTGIDTPLSPRYLRIKAGSKPGDDVTVQHGFSNPRFAWQLARDYGSCPAEMCPWYTIWSTAAMDNAAKVYRAGPTIYGYETIPSYTAALIQLAAKPGDYIHVATDGWEAYAIVGVDQSGRGIWVDCYKRSGPARVQLLDIAAGESLWSRMTTGRSFGPENYVLGVGMRP